MTCQDLVEAHDSVHIDKSTTSETTKSVVSSEENTTTTVTTTIVTTTTLVKFHKIGSVNATSVRKSADLLTQYFSDETLIDAINLFAWQDFDRYGYPRELGNSLDRYSEEKLKFSCFVNASL